MTTIVKLQNLANLIQPPPLGSVINHLVFLKKNGLGLFVPARTKNFPTHFLKKQKLQNYPFSPFSKGAFFLVFFLQSKIEMCFFLTQSHAVSCISGWGEVMFNY